MLQRRRRSTKREDCETLKFSSLSGEFSANVATVTASSVPFFGAAIGAGIATIGYTQKYGSDIAALQLGCDDVPFDEIKELLGDGFKEVNKNVDRNFEAVRENLLAIRGNYLAIEQVNSKIDETLKTVVRAFDHVDDQFRKTNSEMQKGFEKLQALVRQYKIKDVTSDLITFIEDFTVKTDGLKDFAYEQRVALLEGEDGYLQYFKTAANPQGAMSLHALLNRILSGRFAEPKEANDDAGFLALYLLYSGTETYINILRFLVDGYRFLGLYYYNQGDVDAYNHYYYFVSGIVVKEFKNTFFGIGSQVGIVRKVSTVLEKVRSLNFVSNQRNIYDIISRKIEYFKTVKDDLSIYDLRHVLPSRQILQNFSYSKIRTPFLDWLDSRKVRYAVQYVHNGTYSLVGNWSLPYTIRKKACPTLELGEAPPGTTRLLFRRFGEGKSQFIGAVASPDQTEYRDIDRDFFEAVLEGNLDEARMNAAALIADGANITAVFEHGEQAIHAATRAANWDVLQDLVDRGADINARDYRGFTPLHISAELGNEKFVKALLGKGADISVTSHSNWAASHVAAKHGHAKTLQVLFEAEKVNMNAKADGGFTPLHVAVSSRRKRAIEVLSANEKANVNAQSDQLLTPLHLAVLGDHKEEVQLFLSNNRSDANAFANGGLTALHMAASSGAIAIVKRICQHNATNVNAKSDDGWSPLHLAVSLRNKDVTKTLLNETKVDVNVEGKDKLTPLHLASSAGQLVIARELINRGANLEARDSHGYSPLHCAVENDQLDIVKVLLGEKTNVDSKDDRGYTSLGVAVLKGNLNVTEFLLDKNANVNVQNAGGKSLISDAVSSGNKDIVELLVKRGAIFGPETLELAAFNKHWDIVKYFILDEKTIRNGGTPLHTASELGNLDVVMYVFKTGSDVNAKNNLYESPLHCAVRSRNGDVVQYLLEKKAQVNARDGKRNTALHLAASQGVLAIVTFLTAAGASINALNEKHQSALHLASGAGKADIVEHLLAKGANVGTKDAFGETPLHFAVCSGNVQVAKFLIGNGAKVNERDIRGRTALHIAASKGEHDILERLTTEADAFNESENLGLTPLYLGCYSDKLDVLNYLLTTAGVNVNWRDEANATPLHNALRSKNVVAVKVLIVNGAEVDECDLYFDTPLSLAVKWGNLNVVEYLTVKGSSVDKTCSRYKETPLAVAASKGFLDIVKHLKEKGADINKCNGELVSPLHYAAGSGNLELVKYLVENGCDVNTETLSDLTPLEYGVAENGNVDVVKYLLDKGSVYEATKILHLAVMSDSLETVKYFVDRGCNLNINDSERDTLLHYTARYGNLDVLEYLVENGLDINATNDNGETPLFMAAGREGPSNSRMNMVKFLIGKNAEVNATDKSGTTVLHNVLESCDTDLSTYLIENGALCLPLPSCERMQDTQCDTSFNRKKRSINDNSKLRYPGNQVQAGWIAKPGAKKSFASDTVLKHERTTSMWHLPVLVLSETPGQVYKSIENQIRPKIGFKDESPSSRRASGATVSNDQTTYSSSLNENILLVKWFLHLFGRKSFVEGMTRADRVAEGGRREDADWAETYLRQGMAEYAKRH